MGIEYRLSLTRSAHLLHSHYSGFRSDVRGPPLFPLGAATCQLYALYMRVKTALDDRYGMDRALCPRAQ
jgi:hypothetical protein